jgi:hypothetical protein
MSDQFNFSFEEPPGSTRGRGRPRSPKFKAAIEHAQHNPGRWFVVETETIDAGANNKERNVVQARVASRMKGLKDVAKKDGVTLQVATRTLVNEVKGYVLLPEQPEGDK